MYISKRTAVAILTVSVLAGSAMTAATASADHGQGRDRARSEHADRTVLSRSLAPSVPTDPTLLSAIGESH
jgi:hypothetical protein